MVTYAKMMKAGLDWFSIDNREQEGLEEGDHLIFKGISARTFLHQRTPFKSDNEITQHSTELGLKYSDNMVHNHLFWLKELSSIENH